MGLGQLFKQRPGVTAGKALYAACVGQARMPAFYAQLRVPDTVMGRFELYTLHTILAVLRIKGRGPLAAEVAQALFDAYLEGLDIALREMGIGDLSMGKKMKKLGRAFYGRVASWEAALAAREDLSSLIGRTIYEGAQDAGTQGLEAYVIRAVDHLAGQTDEAILRGEIAWPAVTA